ncbi:MAG: sigma-54-dependent Fis family transcriptional regulator [Myxococcales bacterium]|nr:sigma-54-dependent Fis family transcriptional regulator [Myxococcota bacterium]MDW8283592.1 sigma-54-dependent Fis family transcriptional regulator [Myxococcales bacterium]
MTGFLLSCPAVARRLYAVDRRSVLVALGELLRSEVDLDQLLRRVVDLLALAMRADRATLFVVDSESGEIVSRAAHLPELPEIRLPIGQGIAGHVAARREPINIPHADRSPRWNREIDRRTGYRTRSILAVPVLGEAPPGGSERPLLGVIEVLNKQEGIFDEEDQQLLTALAGEVATALRETGLPGRVTGRAQERFNRIVGDSPAMRRIYDLVARAAATTATVLIRGESGTGKELLARAIHVNSQRAQGPFVKIDCTAIPEGLMEAELFGHEKGAFTGADRTVLGKAELAHGGTLFLDEIGDLKGSLQGKLLRLLQDREMERVGGRRTIQVDVRIVAATNRDLLEMTRAGTFRADLYYRLKVVELELPPLRERGPEDIRRLAEHFVEQFARRHRKPVTGLSREAMARLLSHSWPGNIRELEHCIESAVALCSGSLIEAAELPLPGAPAATTPGSADSGLFIPDGMPLQEVERLYIRRTLERAGGNRSEAARMLRIGRNTLLRKLQEMERE